jgi:integrase
MSRKSVPGDVKDEYAKLYGKSAEERFAVGPMSRTAAAARFREWQSEIEGRIANIRAARKGEGRSLTPLAARALSGEWYLWFVTVASAWNWPAPVWDAYSARLMDGLHGAAQAVSGDTWDEFERDPALRARVRPIIADEAKVGTFLAAKAISLDDVSKGLFLDFVTRDFFAAVALLVRRARGDHSPDPYAEQFPAAGASDDPAVTAWGLFERWVADVKPAAGTVSRWRVVFLRLQADFPGPAGALLPEQIEKWANGLVDPERSAGTVAGVWVRAGITVFAWAVTKKLLANSPFVGWHVTVPRKIRNRDTKAFTNDEISTILSAASAIVVVTKGDAAKRWGPFLAAYSGARMGEITQLRGVDIVEQDGVHAMKLLPEAGTVKGGNARTVPLHGHLIDQGFLEFVKASGRGPLFYAVRKAAADRAATNPRRLASTAPRERVAEWVRELGVDDPELSPNHAWRHSFRAVAARCGMSEKVIDAICGHAPASEGRKYGEPTLSDKAQELRKFPRFA